MSPFLVADRGPWFSSLERNLAAVDICTTVTTVPGILPGPIALRRALVELHFSCHDMYLFFSRYLETSHSDTVATS